MMRPTEPLQNVAEARPWIVWLRDGLRVETHPAFIAAAARGCVLPVYIIDDLSPRRAPGAAARWWLRASLRQLRTDIAARGGRLVVRRGASAAVLAELVAETQAAGVCTAREWESGGQAEEADVARSLKDVAVFATVPGEVLAEPGDLLTKTGSPYRVFTPFWNALRARLAELPSVARQPVDIDWYAGDVRSESIDIITVPEEAFGWTEGLAKHWRPGERSARETLAAFTGDTLSTYEEERNFPAVAGTSGLSPYLRFGEIGIRDVWDAVAALQANSNIAPNQCEAWLRELGWREFCRHLLFHFPEMQTENFRRKYDAFDWRSDPAGLRAWQRGLTGYPLVDAGMRQLWQTGWMHNRVRMVVASFLTKHLRIHWRAGEAWFWDTLVDADYANNPANWQWTAGTGADAAPYFRIFNPMTQAKKFDSQGAYIRRWVPELSGIEPGDTYPQPIVDHAAARAGALAANEALR